MAGINDMADDRADSLSGNSQLATFRIGDELFGLGISSIREIVRYPEITAVPRSPEYLTGLANMRGSVLPVVDARVRLGMPACTPTDATRVLVIEHGNASTGLIVDMVCGVISLERVTREAPPPLIESARRDAGVDARYVKSVLKVDNGRKIIMEIDADALCLTELARNSATSSRTLAGMDKPTNMASLNEIQLVTFLIAREEYGFPISSVREVLRIGTVTEVPDVPPYLLGILSIRNALLPVVDIRRLFGLPSLVESLSGELDDVDKYARHLQVSFAQHLSRGAAWTPDAIREAVRRWFDALLTSSEILGRQLQLLRGLFQRLLNLTAATGPARGRALSEADLAHKLEEVENLADQIHLRITDCKQVLAREIQEDQRILVIEIGRMPVGILVDRMQQVIRMPEHIIDQPPTLLNAAGAATLKGIVKLDHGKRLVMLIDQDHMIRSEELAELGDGAYTGNSEAPLEPEQQLSNDTLQLVTFCLGDEEFGLAIEDVQEINRLDDITAVPRAPAFVEGVMNLRGNVIPAIDLRKRFGLPALEHDESTRVIIVTMNGKLTGLIVDSVSEVFRLDRHAIELPPDVVRSDLNTDFINGICKDHHDAGKMIVLIDVSKILAGHEQALLHASLSGVQTQAAPMEDTPPRRSLAPQAVTPAPAPVVAPPVVAPPVEAAPAPEPAAAPAAIPMVEPSLPPVLPVSDGQPEASSDMEEALREATPPAPSAVTHTAPDVQDAPVEPVAPDAPGEPGALDTPVAPVRKKLKRAT